MKRGDHLALAFLTLLPFGWYFEPIFTDACYYLGDLTSLRGSGSDVRWAHDAGALRFDGSRGGGSLGCTR